MKKKFISLVYYNLLILSILFVAVSCATAPPAEEPAPAPPVVTPAPTQPPVTPTPPQVTPVTPDPQAAEAQRLLDELNAAAARAAEARRRAEDFDGQFLFPLDWDSAQDLLDDAEQNRNTSTPQNTRDSVDRFDRAAAAFDALFEKALAEAIAIAERELAAARAGAVNAGAQVQTPDLLAEADSTVDRARREIASGDYYAAKDSAYDAFDMYAALTAALQARSIRQEITNRGFQSYDPGNISAGDAAFDAAFNAYNNKNYSESLERANEALARFTTALNTAWAAIAEAKYFETAAERLRALDLMAHVAAREHFDPADTIFHTANTDFMRQNYQVAIELYDECLPMYTASAQLALQRRAAAQAALDRADQRLLESEETATIAEEILEGGVE